MPRINKFNYSQSTVDLNWGGEVEYQDYSVKVYLYTENTKARADFKYKEMSIEMYLSDAENLARMLRLATRKARLYGAEIAKAEAAARAQSDIEPLIGLS